MLLEQKTTNVPEDLNQLSVEQLNQQAQELLKKIYKIATVIAQKGDFQKSSSLLHQSGFYQSKNQ